MYTITKTEGRKDIRKYVAMATYLGAPKATVDYGYRMADEAARQASLSYTVNAKGRAVIASQ